jgi:hypothetical protein
LNLGWWKCSLENCGGHILFYGKETIHHASTDIYM